jgi:hypothetical protein
MQEHLCARCGEYTLLFSVENVGFIEPVPAQARFVPRQRQHRGSELYIDIRRLLGISNPAPFERCVMLKWRSKDGARQATLLIDAVEEIVNCQPGDLIEVPFFPARLRPLCDQVMRDPRGTLRLRVKPDVQLAMDLPEDKRLLMEAMFSRETAAAEEVSP